MSKKNDRKRRNWGSLPEKLPHPIIDTHAHIDMISGWVDDINKNNVAKNRERIHNPTLAEITNASAAVGVERFIQCACEISGIETLSDTLNDIEKNQIAGSNILKSNIPKAISAAAIHPNEAALHDNFCDPSPDGLIPIQRDIHKNLSLDEAIVSVENIIKADKRVIVVGETGLDYFRTAESGRQSQIKSFREHIRLAKDYNLTLQIHDRLAHFDVMDILQRDKAPERVIFHSFSGDSQMAEACTKKGWFLSFSGPITYKTNDDIRKALFATNKDYILLETDCPFLTPEPVRGGPNAPAYTAYTAKYISTLLDMDLEEFCKLTFNNTLNSLGI
ncbi:MAG: TatD family hydrolase [Bifidobacteriaceae bacterium]|jgi:TatD DNase family protein|nr:TatD family hydrolase [Bifidobacteriaceae bacterium]